MNKTKKARTVIRRKAVSVSDVALRRATISQTKNHLSALIERVRHGESITIVDRDRPVAVLAPIATADAVDDEDRLQRLERAGLIRRGTGDLRALFDTWTPVRPQRPADLLEALLDERREDWR